VRFHSINPLNSAREVLGVLDVNAWSVTRAEIQNGTGSNCKTVDNRSSCLAHMTGGGCAPLMGVSPSNHEQLSPLSTVLCHRDNTQRTNSQLIKQTQPADQTKHIQNKMVTLFRNLNQLITFEKISRKCLFSDLRCYKCSLSQTTHLNLHQGQYLDKGCVHENKPLKDYKCK